MGAALALAFIGIPILEVVVFIQAGNLIGLWPTVAGIVLTAVVGAALVRHQGLSTLIKARENLDSGRFPVAEVFDGLCLVLAGAFLITPGFVTDSVGFLLLVPPLRATLRRTLGRHMMASGRVSAWADGPPSGGSGASPRRDHDGNLVIEGEYKEVSSRKDDRSEDDPRQSGTSPWSGPNPPSPRASPRRGEEDA